MSLVARHRTPRLLAPALAALAALAALLSLAPGALADPNKDESGKGRSRGESSQARPAPASDHGDRGCAERVRELEAENARLRERLRDCDRGPGPGPGPGGHDCGRRHDCPPDHPCPCPGFPCHRRPGAPCGPPSGGDDDDGCVRSHGYWKNHQPWPTDGRICRRSWEDILSSESEGDAWIILGRQWVAARLNQAAGADVPAEVAAALRDGGRLLESCSISAADRDRALRIKDVLDAYVNGRMGVDKCR